MTKPIVHMDVLARRGLLGAQSGGSREIPGTARNLNTVNNLHEMAEKLGTFN